jgi:hypothetical protein
MGLFSKPKTPSLDTGALNRINEQNAAKQRDLIAQRMAGLQPLNQQFEQKRTAFSNRIEPESENLLAKFGQETSQLGAADQAAREAATNKFREQAFRDVPAVQQAIRNQLSGNRLMGSGAALSSLAKPMIGAVQSSADFAAQNEQERLQDEAASAQKVVDTNFNVRQQAMANRLGIDKDTLDTLTQMGRTDLVDKFNSLAGVEEQYGANQLGIEQARQQNEMARAASGGSGWGSSLGSLAGMGIGALAGGPLGGVVGGQLGGMAGGYASGENATQFDPTLLFAMAQRNKNAVSKSLGGGRSTPMMNSANYSPY